MHALRLLLVAAALAGSPAGADETTLDALKRELAALRERVSELEARLAAAEAEPRTQVPPAATPDPARREPTPRVTVGGRIKLDVIASSVSAGGPGGTNRGDLALSPGGVPLSDAGEAHQTSFSAHGSRLWFKALQPTRLGETAAFLELDFFSRDAGDERVTNSYTPRLRHGYGEWDGWTFGQTYTTFMNVSAFPELNDDGIPAGAVLVRQPLVRRRFELPAEEFDDVRWALDLAAESPESTIVDPAGDRFSPDDDRLPDLVARVTADGAFGNVSLAAMVRELRIDDPVPARGEDTATGYALSASGRLQLGGADDLRFALSGGNALGRYLSSNGFDGARVNVRGRLRLTDSAGGFAALQHWWSPRWRSNLTLGAAWQAGRGAAPTENEWLATMHANLLYSPYASTTLGLEWIHAWRRRFDDHAGHLDRLQFTALHTF